MFITRFFLSLHLYRIFWNRTPRHPLFVMRFRHLPPVRHRPEWLNTVLVTVFGTLICSIMTFVPAAVVIVTALLLLAILFIPLGGTMRGLVLTGEVARGIVLENQDSARMDVFNLMPPGQLGIAWLLAARAVRLSRRYRLFSLGITLAQWIVGALAFFISLLLLISIVDWRFFTLPSILYLGLGAIPLLWLIFDNLQSPILGLVCGLWGATFGNRPSVAWTAAVGACVTISLLVLVMAWFLAAFLAVVIDGSILGYTYNNQTTLVIALISMPFMSFALRDIGIRLVWASVCKRMNANGKEMLLV